MKIYALRTTADAQGDLVSFGGDKAGRLTDFFVRNKGDGKFLKFTTPQAIAQEFLTPEAMSQTDYLEADLSIPIFSIRAANILEARIPGEMEFYPLRIKSDRAELEFRLCKVRTYTSLVDEANSSFHVLSDGTPLLNDTVYFADFGRSFHIARDASYPSRCVVSQAFVDLCAKNGLHIAFSELPQTTSAPPST